MSDSLTKRIRLVEQDIDTTYKTNPLLQLPFSSSAWHLLGAYEDILFLDEAKEQPSRAKQHSLTTSSSTLIMR